MFASLRHAFAIPRRGTSQTRPDDLAQWSQWDKRDENKGSHTFPDERPGPALVDPDGAVVDHAPLGAIEVFIDELPKRARAKLAADGLAGLGSSPHLAASLLVIVVTAILAGALLVALASVGAGTAAWLGSIVGCLVNAALARTWRRNDRRCNPPRRRPAAPGRGPRNSASSEDPRRQRRRLR